MFLVSRKFHDEFGIAGTEVTGTDAERKAQQGKGWEWWPSVFWQVFWAWIFAPIILWKARRIEDTHGWRLQTMACCLAGLVFRPEFRQTSWLRNTNLAALEKVTRESDVADRSLRATNGPGQQVFHSTTVVRSVFRPTAAIMA